MGLDDRSLILCKDMNVPLRVHIRKSSWALSTSCSICIRTHARE